jgi:hypothetical protein
MDGAISRTISIDLNSILLAIFYSVIIKNLLNQDGVIMYARIEYERQKGSDWVKKNDNSDSLYVKINAQRSIRPD